MLMMRALYGPRLTQRPADADDARCLPAHADADDARPLCSQVETQRPADADDALPLWAQV